LRIGSKAALYGIAGVGLAGLVILSGSSMGVLNLASSGALSILLTDPPNVPEGVSAVYITYSNLEVHAVGFGDSGWIAIAGRGTIDTLGLMNLSQTISTGTVPSLSYNLIAFNITGATVEFKGQNYTASVASEKLVVPIVGGLRVNSSSPSAALVDFQPTVLNLGTQSNPDFALTSGARALQVPRSELRTNLHAGQRLDLDGRAWFQSFAANHTGELAISRASLSANSFSITVTNPDSEEYSARLIALSPATTGAKPAAALSSLLTSIVFVVGPDGSLTLASGVTGQLRTALSSSGFTIPAKSSRTFSFSGSISTLLPKTLVSGGSRYFVVVLGSEPPLTQTVTAA